MELHPINTKDAWTVLKEFTPARIALGRTGNSLPLQHLLEFRMAHAHARDAVFASLDKSKLMDYFQSEGHPCISLHTLAANRNQYLQNPNLGRSLDEVSAKTLKAYSEDDYTIAIIIADGLSATAVNEHAIPVTRLLLAELKKMNHRYSPVCLVQQGRVAIGDEIGAILKAIISIVLIGERPGLSSPDSMGIYLTYQPQKGMTDEKRNCISNIRRGGLSYQQAVHQLIYLIHASLRLRLSGFNLKDQSGNHLLI